MTEPDHLSIRPLVPADAAQVLALNADARPQVAPLDLAEFTRLHLLSSFHLAATKQGALLGYALLFARENVYDGEEFLEFRALIAPRFLYIDQIVIAQQARRHGIGRRIYQAIARLALDDHIRDLCCEVNLSPANPDSLAFHDRLGFHRLRSLNTRDGRHVDLLHTHLPLRDGFADQ